MRKYNSVPISSANCPVPFNKSSAHPNLFTVSFTDVCVCVQELVECAKAGCSVSGTIFQMRAGREPAGGILNAIAVFSCEISA